MAKCPKCGRKLTLFDWRPNCPGCGVNIVYYNLDERLQDEADVAEAEHARLQKRIDRLKASFIGSKLTIARIFLSILPIATLLLPLANVNFSAAVIHGGTVDTDISLISLINVVSNLNFDHLFTMLGSELLGNAFLGYLIALGALALSLVFVLVSLFALMAACGPKGNIRNIILNSVTILLAVVSIIGFNMFSKGITAVFPDFFTGKISYGIFVYIAALLLLLGINIVITIKGTPVKYKLCTVGGIPADEYFELVEKGVEKEKLREMMHEALEKERMKKEKAETAEKEKSEEETVEA